MVRPGLWVVCDSASSGRGFAASGRFFGGNHASARLWCHNAQVFCRFTRLARVAIRIAQFLLGNSGGRVIMPAGP